MLTILLQKIKKKK